MSISTQQMIGRAKREFVHTTKSGQKIRLSDLSDSHLLNIINRIERLSQTGMTVIRGGTGSLAEDMWADEEDLIGNEVLDLMNHTEYVAEYDRRKNTHF